MTVRNNIPSSWVQVDLSEIVVARKGKKPLELSSEPKDGYCPYILIDEMEGRPIRSYTNDPKVPIAKEKDVLIVWDGSIGKTACGLKGAVGSTIVALTPILIETKYLEAFLRCSKPYIEQTSRGSSLQHISPESFWKLRVPLAPLSEQRRIVTKLEKLQSKVERCKTGLEKIPAILKRFRQSVLAAASSGRLTEDWRGTHTDVEGPEDLLKRIEEERTRKYQEKCEKAKKEGSRKPKKINLSTLVNRDSVDFEFPTTWILVNLESICLDIVDCPHSTPKWTNEEKICLRTTNFRPNQLDWSEVRYVSEQTYRGRITRLKPFKGDILYSREGGILGIACMLDKDIDVCLGQRMMLMRPSVNISNIFVTYFLNSPITLSHVHSLVGGSASPHVNVGDIKRYPIALPPFEEQIEIVSRVEALFKIADQIETRYQYGKTQVDNLTQSILAKAFRGELVPTEAELARLEGRFYEPASALLAKIEAQRKDVKPQRKAGRSRRRKRNK